MTDEKLGTILFLIGDKGMKGTDEFGDLDPVKTLEVLTKILDALTTLREHIVTSMIETIMGNHEDEDEGEDEEDSEGKLH
jgi:hypothetical protein